MSIEERPFAPLYNPTQNIAPGPGQAATQAQQGQFAAGVSIAASSNAAVAGTLPGQLAGNGPCQLYVQNKTAVWVHVNVGASDASGDVRAATRADPGVPPGATRVLTVNPECNRVSVYADGTVGAAPADIVNVHRGSGV